MQTLIHTPALLAVLLTTTLAACAPTAGPVVVGTPQASFIKPAPQPRLGFNNFTPPNI